MANRIMLNQTSFHGAGAIEEIVNEIRANGFKKVFVATDPDLVKFGVITELVGRVRVITALDNLDEEALVKIMSEPKNALIKQYQVLLGMDNVELCFDEDAVEAIADMALKRNTGARGLRSIIEETMTELMFNVPSEPDVKKCIIHKNTD